MSEEVRAEMVASVLEVSVSAGDVVDAGATLMVLESMKMEIPVLSEGSGEVFEVKVEPGDVVRAGDLLAVLN